jgi:hypothetical protein
MYLRKSDNVEIWGNCHPADVECNDGEASCECKYHVLDVETKEIFSFEDWSSANEKFVEMTGAAIGLENGLDNFING